MSSIPHDALVVQNILKEMGVTEYEPRVVSQLLEFAYRYTIDLLEDARSVSEHAGKKQIDETDVQFAIDHAGYKISRKSPNIMLPGSEMSGHVWIPDSVDGFVIGRVVDIRSDSLTVQTTNASQPTIVRYDDVFPAEDDCEKDFEDNCSLVYLNEATLLHNCRQRYLRKQFYTYVANILIAINPYEQLTDLYETNIMENYRGKSIGTLRPHIFAIADNSYRDMLRMRQSQSIIISGESGAGKTESQKQVLRYLCHSYGESDGSVEQRLLETNAILESFGNAKTVRNNNSSRFGKFVEVHFGKKQTIAGGLVSHYLLEKSRICGQNTAERNYHIFYQLIAGADDQLWNRLRLQSPDAYCGTDLNDVMVDDYNDFGHLISAFSKLGLSSEQVHRVFECVAAVLHLGNIHFSEKVEDFRGKCAIDSTSEPSLSNASFLLGVDEADLRRELLTRVMQPTRGGAKGTLYLVPLKMSEACAARDALAKAIYSRLFDQIVSWINSSIPFTESATYIGVLDAAGFEFFSVNSFEQFCINFSNEKLQHFFNECVLRNEQDFYMKEGLSFERVKYSDNQECIDLFEGKPNGLFTLLDDEARLPRPSCKHFTAAVHRAHRNHALLLAPRLSKIREQRAMHDDDGFVIRHYASPVCYDTTQFLEKNNDSLHVSLNILMEQSTNPLIATLFHQTDFPTTAMKSASSSKKLVAESVSRKFRLQLDMLIDKLRRTGTHFVRCIKPNSEMTAGKFDGVAILDQLKCAGMASVMRVMQAGFPSRTSFGEIVEHYRTLLPQQLSRLDPRLFCKCLFHALGLNENDFAFGLTKAFFRAGKFAQFDQMLRQDKAEMLRLITLAASWLYRARWRKLQCGVLCTIKLQLRMKYRSEQLRIIQSHVRGLIARRTHRPRIMCLTRVRALTNNIDEMTTVLKKLPMESQLRWTPQLETMRENIELLVTGIKRDPLMPLETVTTRYEHLVRDAETLLLTLRKQISGDEKDSTQRMENGMGTERRKEWLRQQNEEGEGREQVQEQENKRQFQKKKEQEGEKVRETLRRETMPSLTSYENEKQKGVGITQSAIHPGKPQMEEQQHSESAAVCDRNTICNLDLTKWKYVDLRNAITSSKDAEFSSQCKKEYHRRVRAYYEWKQKNASRKQEIYGPHLTTLTSEVLNNESVVNEGNNNILHIQEKNFIERAQRFFKVPLSSAISEQRELLTRMNGSPLPCDGVWYGHFDGRCIRREMIVRDMDGAVLRIADDDDWRTCATPLEHALLARHKGAEITAHQFDSAWEGHGGRHFDYRMRI